MSKKLLLAGIITAFARSALPIQAGVLIDKNFNADTVGGNPGVSYINEPASTDIHVVDSTSTPADPFGGVGNRSLFISDTGANSPAVGWTTAGFVNETNRTKLSMKAYVVSNATYSSTYAIIQAGKNNATNSSLTSTEAAVQLTIRNNGLVAQSGATALTLDQTINTFGTNSVWDVVISIVPETRTWSAMINGRQLTDNSGAITSFNFRDNAAVDGINFVSLEGQSANSGNLIFWDDVKLETIPEPAMPGLIILSGSGLMSQRICLRPAETGIDFFSK